MGLIVAPARIPAATPVEEDAVEAALEGLMDAYARVREARRRIDEARATEIEYKAAFREHFDAKSLFTSYALEYARVLAGDDID